MEPLISVLISVYNQENFLAESIDSVLAQTFVDFELIIVDDGSKDSSIKIINEYALKDSRIVPLLLENGGRPRAIGAGVKIAKGKFLAFIDHDDLMSPERLEKQVAYHNDNEDIHASSSHCYYIDEKSAFIGKQQYANLKTKEDSKIAREKKQIVICAFSGLMVYKSVFLELGGLRSEFWPNDDGDFFNRLIEKGYNLVIIQDFLMKYRIHLNQNSFKNEAFFNRAAYADHCARLRKDNKSEITFPEFEKILRAKPKLTQFKNRMHHLSLGYHQKAGFAFFTKNYPSFIYLFTIAFVLSPLYVYASVAKRFR